MAADRSRILKHRDFTAILGASFFSDAGTWMQIAALSIYAAHAKGEASWVGAITVIGYLGLGLFSPLGGVLADRYDRRWVAGISVTMQALFSFALAGAFVAGWRSPALLLALAGAQSVMVALETPTITAMIPDLVEDDLVHTATSLFQVSWNVGRAFGPILAVLAIEHGSYETAFVFNGISFLCITVSMFTIRPHPRVTNVKSSTIEHIREGMRAIRATPATWAPLAIGLMENLCIAPFIAFIPILSQLTLHGGASSAGHLFAAQGVGSAVGVLVLTSQVRRFGEVRMLNFAILSAGVFAIGFALSPSVVVAIGLVLPLSAVHTYLYSTTASMISRSAPEYARARVISLFLMITQTGFTLSSIGLSILADHVGSRTVLVGAAGAFLLCSIAFCVLVDRESSAVEVRGLRDADAVPLVIE